VIALSQRFDVIVIRSIKKIDIIVAYDRIKVIFNI